MKTGMVKSWNRQRGFGFIVSDDEEYFVNINDVHITLKNTGLKEGQRITFNVKSDMKGDRAVNVKAG